MKYLQIFLLSVIALFAQMLNAQNFDEVDFPLSAFGNELDYGFLGGLTNPNFSNVDLNQDGALDLLVFDRNGNRIYTFLHSGTQGEADFQHAPEYESMFPSGLHSWVLMLDYDGDGVEDIFAAPLNFANGISVWKGSVNNGIWSFDPIRFEDNPEESILYFDEELASGNIQQRSIYVSFNVDLPAITDMDGDGDIDILNFEQGGSYLRFYRNMSVENNLGLENMAFELGESCWGKVKEGDLDSTIELNADDNIENTPCLIFTMIQEENDEDLLVTERHSGSSVLALDGDGDGDMDAVIGDIGSSELLYLQNGGSVDFARVDVQIKDWPPSEGGVDQYVFAAGHHLDVNNDGRRDLVTVSLSKTSGITLNHIWYYRNTGTDAAPIFELDRKNFLMNETINIGSYTAPTFVDYNQDGLMDIVVGNDGYKLDGSTTQLGVHLFENVGAADAPAFELVDDDYLGFSALDEFTGRLSFAYGDMDSDGDDDLIVGDQSSGSSDVDLFYFENIAGPGQPMEYNGYLANYMDVDPGGRLKPQIIDLNQDGLMDLVIGETNNTGVGGVFTAINYFENIGSSTDPMFESNINSAPNLSGIVPVNSSDLNVAPYFYPSENGLLLFAGTSNGKIMVFENYDQETQLFELKDDSLGDINIGEETRPAVYDIDNDGYLELLIGNRRGGLDFYNTTYTAAGLDTGSDDVILVDATLFPNPTSGTFYISSEENISSVAILDMMGRALKTWSSASDQYQINELQTGSYLVRVQTTDGRAGVYKLMVSE